MDFIKLMEKFRSWETNNERGLTLDECLFLLEQEEKIDFYDYQNIMDYRDHLEFEVV